MKSRSRGSDALLAVAGAGVPPLIYYCGPGAFPAALLAAVFAFFLCSFFGEREFKDSASDAAFKALGMAYIALPFSYFAMIAGLGDGQWWILFLFAVIWANDTFAYITGKKLGSHKLCPSISPKKTVEGAVGGIIGGVAAALLFNHYAGMGVHWAVMTALAVVLGLVGMAGDLAESVLKRAAGVKDSGSIVPGHGGVLDRTDSLIFTIPLLYYYLIALNRALAG